MRQFPFSFLEEVVAGGGGFPALTGGLVDYWQSNLGLTGTSNVSAWVGQANSETLTYAANSIGPSISGSNAGFNSVDTLTFNGTNQGMGKVFSNLGGTNTGEVYMSIYAAPHHDGTDWGAQHGFSSPAYSGNNAGDFSEIVGRSENATSIQIYGYPGPGYINSNDDTYGKGIYTNLISSTQGVKFFNKGTTANASGALTAYKTTRQGYTIGSYNFNNPGLFGKIDVAGVAIWTNPTDYAADITAIESYFQGIYG